MVNLEREVKPKEVFPNFRARWGYHRVSLMSIFKEVSISSMVDPDEGPPSQSGTLLIRQYIVDHARPTTAPALEFVDKVQKSLTIKEEKK